MIRSEPEGFSLGDQQLKGRDFIVRQQELVEGVTREFIGRRRDFFAILRTQPLHLFEGGNNLELEFTERLLMHDVEKTLQILVGLKDLVI